jgi:hypothetical protein
MIERISATSAARKRVVDTRAIRIQGDFISSRYHLFLPQRGGGIDARGARSRNEAGIHRTPRRSRPAAMPASDGHNRDDGEARPLAQLTQGKPDVLT